MQEATHHMPQRSLEQPLPQGVDACLPLLPTLPRAASTAAAAARLAACIAPGRLSTTPPWLLLPALRLGVKQREGKEHTMHSWR